MDNKLIPGQKKEARGRKWPVLMDVDEEWVIGKKNKEKRERITMRGQEGRMQSGTRKSRLDGCRMERRGLDETRGYQEGVGKKHTYPRDAAGQDK